MTLADLTLDQIPALTDEECDRLYAELSGQRLIPTREEAAEYVAGYRISCDSCYSDHFCKITVAGQVFDFEQSFDYPTTKNGQRLVALLAAHPDPEIEAEIAEYRFEPDRVCRPDCPASVLEGLPALVERATGRADVLLLPIVGKSLGVEWGGDLTIEEQQVLDAFNRTMKYRHLAHACLSAAFAACVVLGRHHA